MTKVCHVTSAHKRYDGRIFKKELSSLSKKYDCYLVCCDGLKNETINNIKIISACPKFKNRYERILKAKKYLKKECKKIDADIYHFHDADLLPLAYFFSKKGKKVIFDYHENFEDLFLERKWIPSFLRKILRKKYIKLEQKSLPNFSGIIAADNYIRDIVLKYNKNSITIQNFPIIIPKQTNKNKDNYICFAGNLADFWNHDKICEAISDIDIKYIIAGNYNNDIYNTLSNCRGFDKVELLGQIDYDSVISLYNKSKIGIALCSYIPNMNYKNGSLGNTKIFEYMMCGIPVVFTDFKVYTDINKKCQFGISVNPTNVKEIRNAIKYLLKNPKEAQKMGNNGRQLIEKEYNWSVLEKRLLDFYKNL